MSDNVIIKIIRRQKEDTIVWIYFYLDLSNTTSTSLVAAFISAAMELVDAKRRVKPNAGVAYPHMADAEVWNKFYGI